MNDKLEMVLVKSDVINSAIIKYYLKTEKHLTAEEKNIYLN
ncbi:hypothetical protein [Anaerocolumna aminovalerica]|nr:hypothetical protein [Anaerocolumna aminovalerica]